MAGRARRGDRRAPRRSVDPPLLARRDSDAPRNHRPSRPPSSSISAPTTCPATSASSIFCRRRSPSRHGSTSIAFLESIGAPVPALYDADPARRAMLVEDVGTALPARQLSAVPAPTLPTCSASPPKNCSACTSTAPRESTIDASRARLNTTAGCSNGSSRNLRKSASPPSRPAPTLHSIAPELADIAARLDRYFRAYSRIATITARTCSSRMAREFASSISRTR